MEIIPWGCVCSCVIIPMDDAKIQRIERLGTPEQKQTAMRHHYEKYGELLPDADCKNCNGSGDSRDNT